MINHAPSNYGELAFDFASKEVSMRIWTPGKAAPTSGLADEYVIQFTGCSEESGGCIPDPVGSQPRRSQLVDLCDASLYHGSCGQHHSISQLLTAHICQLKGRATSRLSA